MFIEQNNMYDSLNAQRNEDSLQYWLLKTKKRKKKKAE